MKLGELAPFLVHGTTEDRHPYAVGGFCRVESVHQVKEAFETWKKTEFGGSVDGYLIDKKLSRMVRQTAGSEVFAAGASIWIAGCKEPAGGVIGRPGAPDESAQGIRQRLWESSEEDRGERSWKLSEEVFGEKLWKRPIEVFDKELWERSGEALGDEQGEGLWLMAWPGRLGLVVSASEEKAAQLEKKITRRLFGTCSLDWAGRKTMSGQAADYFNEYSLDRAAVLEILDSVKSGSPLWLLVADGCGSQAGGVFLGAGSGNEEWWLCQESSEVK